MLAAARQRAATRFRIKVFSALWLSCGIAGTVFVQDIAVPYWVMMGIVGFPVALTLFYATDRYLGRTEFAETHSVTYTALMYSAGMLFYWLGSLPLLWLAFRILT